MLAAFEPARSSSGTSAKAFAKAKEKSKATKSSLEFGSIIIRPPQSFLTWLQSDIKTDESAFLPFYTFFIRFSNLFLGVGDNIHNNDPTPF